VLLVKLHDDGVLSDAEYIRYSQELVASSITNKGELPSAAERIKLLEADNAMLKQQLQDNSLAVLLSKVLAEDEGTTELLGTAASASASASASAVRRRRMGVAENVAGASAWLKAAQGRIVLGAEADVSLFRAGAGVLATGGGFKVGPVADGACAAAEHSGILRWSATEGKLQVCSGADGWTTAGAAEAPHVQLGAVADGACAAAENSGILRLAGGGVQLCAGASSTWLDVYTPVCLVCGRVLNGPDWTAGSRFSFPGAYPGKIIADGIARG
jgi:hypothetical protein